jgi:hypothetical protein
MSACVNALYSFLLTQQRPRDVLEAFRELGEIVEVFLVGTNCRESTEQADQRHI